MPFQAGISLESHVEQVILYTVSIQKIACHLILCVALSGVGHFYFNLAEMSFLDSSDMDLVVSTNQTLIRYVSDFDPRAAGKTKGGYLMGAIKVLIVVLS